MTRRSPALARSDIFSAISGSQRIPNGEPIRIAFGILGDQGSGIRRHAGQIAAGVDEQPGSSVATLSADLRRGSATGRVRSAISVARRARGAEVLVLPHSRYGIWSDGIVGVLQVLAAVVLGPPVVFVLHDVYGDGRRRADRLMMRIMVERASVVVQEPHELRSLPRSLTGRRPELIPLPVDAPASSTKDAARARLGIDVDRPVLGVLGWIHPRKRHADVLRALPLMAGDPLLWFIGGPSNGDQTIVDELEALAVELGVAERLLVTGYVPDDELALRVAACDLGVCVYSDASASASALSWIGAGRPIVGSAIDVMHGLQEEAPEMVVIADGGSPRTLAESVQQVLVRASESPEVDRRIRSTRSSDVVADRYLQLFRSLAS